MKKTLIASIILASMLGGCSAFEKFGHKENQFTGEYERNSMSKGMAAGAVVGGAAAAVVTGGSSAIIYSALVGTEFFGFIGLSNDSDADKTLKYLRENGLIVENGYKTITISFAEDVTFDLQKTNLKDEFKPTLKGVAMILNELDGKAKFEVIGHADYTGNLILNNYLSEERATVVTEELIKIGVNPKNFIEIKGVNSSEPKDYCLDLSCLRRVELIIHKNDILYNM